MHLGFSAMNTPGDPPPAVLARALEERGFESLWYGEHSHIPVSRRTPYPAGGELPDDYKFMMDPYVSLAAAASNSSTLKLGTSVALLLERDVFSQAKTIATLDRLAGGRVIIGAGVGWNQEEFENVCRHPWNKRFGVMRETVAATRALWNRDEVEYHGDYVDFDPVWCLPGPLQPKGPPIVFGAMGPLGMHHAAQWADGWMPVDLGLRNVLQSIASFREMVARAGRDPADVPVTIQTMATPSLDTLQRYRDHGVLRVLIGVDADMRYRSDNIMPMIDRFAPLIPDLAE